MRIEVLGAVRLKDSRGEPVEVPERKVRALLAVLTLSRGETIPADTLVERVWGQDLPGNPHRVLQAKLSQLRSFLDRAGTGGRHMVTREAGGYRLAGAGEKAADSVPDVQMDAEELRRCVSQADAVSHPDERLALLDGVDRLWRGRPLGEFADELWAAPEVAALEELRLHAAELQAVALLQTGRPGSAYSVVHPFLDEYPTREGLVSAAMHAAYLTRRQPEALRVYERLRSHLAEEFGVDPGAEIQTLFQEILRQDPELEPAALRTAEAGQSPGESSPDPIRPQGNIPGNGSVFLGREEERAAVMGFLRQGRLLTVLGVGGVGKTRLATVVARSVVRSGEEHSAVTDTGAAEAPGSHSAWFADLTVLPANASHESIAQLVAAMLEIPGTHGAGSELLPRVASVLEERQGLLVLDNCEHVIAAAAAFTADLLNRTERVRVVATSREPLGLSAEQRFPLTPLAVENGSSADNLGNRAPAVELFLSRARATAPHIRLGEADIAVVAELCRRLDGLPLAIELAAGRMSMLSARDLLDRITDRLDLLARPGRGAPRRQQTLRGMLDWSWELLDEPERALLRRLAVHPASWTLDTVESVCADVPASSDAPGCQRTPSASGEASAPVLRRSEVLSALASLADRSLVSTVHAESGDGVVVRYRLLETVAAYAGEKLEDSGERHAVASRHISYHRAMVECARDFLFGPHVRDWVRWIGQEQAHLNHALREALQTGDGANAVALTLSTFWYRWMTGRTEHLVDELVSVAACPGPRDAAHAQVAVLAATACDGESEESRHHAAPEPAAVWPIAFSRTGPGAEGPEGAEALSERAFDEHTRRWCERVLEALGRFAEDEEGVHARMQVQWFAATPLMASAEYREAGERLADEAIRYLLAVGDLSDAAFAVTQRDWFLLDHWGVRPRGLPGTYDAEAILRSHGDDYGLTQVLSVSNLVAEIDGDAERARLIAEEAAELAAELELTGEVAYWECILALVCLRSGELSAGADHVKRAKRLAAQVGFGFALVLAQAGEAAFAMRCGDRARAEDIVAGFTWQDWAVAHRCVTRVLGEGALPVPGLSAGAEHPPQAHYDDGE